MEHENQIDLTQQETEVDEDRDIHRFAEHELDADDLYELRVELEHIGLVDLAARVEIERGNVLSHDGYMTSFTAEETMHVAFALNSAAHVRGNENREDRLDVISEIAEKLSEVLQEKEAIGIPGEDGDVEVDVSDEAPTVEDMGIDMNDEE